MKKGSAKRNPKAALKKKMEQLDEDFKWLKVNRKKQAKAIGLGTNEVKLGQLYQCQIFDAGLIEKLVALRDKKMAEVEKVESSI